MNQVASSRPGVFDRSFPPRSAQGWRTRTQPPWRSPWRSHGVSAGGPNVHNTTGVPQGGIVKGSRPVCGPFIRPDDAGTESPSIVRTFLWLKPPPPTRSCSPTRSLSCSCSRLEAASVVLSSRPAHLRHLRGSAYPQADQVVHGRVHRRERTDPLRSRHHVRRSGADAHRPQEHQGHRTVQPRAGPPGCHRHRRHPKEPSGQGRLRQARRPRF